MKESADISTIFSSRSRISDLQSIGVSTLSQLKKLCIAKNKTYIPLTFPSLRRDDTYNINIGVARELENRNLILPREVDKQFPITCYYPEVSLKTIKALRLHDMRTVGEVCKKCVIGDVFKSFKGKKVGPRTNYELAKMLLKLKFISQESFLKVPLPSWRTRFLTDEEVGEDAGRLLSEMDWDESTQYVIRHAVSLKFPDGSRTKRVWEYITLGELVKTFVRMRSSGETYFYTKGHIGSHWYMTSWNIEKFETAFVEIKKKLKELDFITDE